MLQGRTIPRLLVLALCLMGPGGVTIRLNVGSQGTYSCHIKKNKSRGA